MTTAKLALVTGGARGIGLACAKALAADGFTPILADLNPDTQQVAAAMSGYGYICDFADVSAITALFDEIEAEHGPVQVLVNNAGIANPGDFLTYDIEAFQQVIDVNLRGVFVASQRMAQSLVAHTVAPFGQG